MPSGNPDPNCKDCKGKGKIDLFISSSICDCVNKESDFDALIEHIGDPLNKITFNNRYYMEPKCDFSGKILKIQKATEKLKWSAEEIADGITTWQMWPGICGETCNGCGAEMNVLGMSYNHWCPLCDPDGKEYVMCIMDGWYRMPYDRPAFGPSMHIIHEGIRIAEDRREK